MSIRLTNVSFAFPQQTALIQDATLHIEAGVTGIVGPNGAGKSTLLNLIEGRLAPNTGQVACPHQSFARCGQIASQSEVEDFANAWTKSALRWMSLLELEPDDYWRWDELSAGMRRKWQIAAALDARPEVLMLDEPSNHLDIEGRDQLISAVQQFDGICLLVSHDRALLDALATSIVWMEGHVVQYAGNYTAAKMGRDQYHAEQLGQLESLQAERDLAKDKAGVAKSRHASTIHGTNTKSRMTSVKDSDGRSVNAKTRAAMAEAKAGQQSKVAIAAQRASQSKVDSFEYRPKKTYDIEFTPAECPYTWLIDRSGPVRIGSRTLAEDVTLQVGRHDRIWLTGPNGCGKSTLLRDIQRNLPDRIAENTLWLPQNLDEIRTVVADYLAAETDLQPVYNAAAALGLDPSQLHDQAQGTDVSRSPGQSRKAAMAIGLAQSPWLLLMDEPTNDLDVLSIERIENALQAYEGGLLIISHDTRFIETLGCRQFAFPMASESE